MSRTCSTQVFMGLPTSAGQAIRICRRFPRCVRDVVKLTRHVRAWRGVAWHGAELGLHATAMRLRTAQKRPCVYDHTCLRLLTYPFMILGCSMNEMFHIRTPYRRAACRGVSSSATFKYFFLLNIKLNLKLSKLLARITIFF